MTPAATRPRSGLTWRLTTAALGRFSTDRIFGLLWWLVDPLVMVAVYLFVFSYVWPVVEEDDRGTYALFLACGLIPWRWFSVVTTRGANAFFTHAGLLTSTPVDRRVIVLSEVWASTIEALLGVPVLLALMLWLDRPITPNLLWLPLPLLIMGVFATGVAYLLCPLNVLVRDTANLHAAVLRVLWFLSPGLYSLGLVSERLDAGWTRVYVALNPFVGLLEGVRRPLHDGLPPPWEALGWSAAWALLALALGRWAFGRMHNAAVRML